MARLYAGLEPLKSDPEATAVIVDFDGTLAVIVDQPEDSQPLPAARSALKELVAAVGTVAVISGRPVEFLISALDVSGVMVFGQYGLERIENGQVVVDERAQTSIAVVAEAQLAAVKKWPDLLIEHKGDLALGVHWRTTPDRAPEPDDLKAFGAQFGLESLPGRMTWEFRPVSTIDKGVVVADILAQRKVRSVLCAGDDVGDIPMFAALNRWEQEDPTRVAVRIGVNSEEAPQALLDQADLVVSGPSELAEILSALASAC